MKPMHYLSFPARPRSPMVGHADPPRRSGIRPVPGHPRRATCLTPLPSVRSGLVRGLLWSRDVRPARAILLVESDAGCGQALARLVRRSGDRVRLVRTPGAAVAAAQRESYDMAVVDLFVKGGGVDLARRLTRRVPRVYLSVGARMLTDELLEAVIGFPVLRKRDLHRAFVRPA